MGGTPAGVDSMIPKSSFQVRCAAHAEEVTVKEILVKTLATTLLLSQSIMLNVFQCAICVQMTIEIAGEYVSNALKKFLETKTSSLTLLNQNQNLLVLLVRSSAMSVNSRTWNAGKDATPASTHISTKTTKKMDKLKKMRRPLTSTSVIAISRTMPVGRIATEKRKKSQSMTILIVNAIPKTMPVGWIVMGKRTKKKKRTMGQITTEKIITERTKKKKTMAQITMEKIITEKTKKKKTMAQITTERTTMENRSTEFLSLPA